MRNALRVGGCLAAVTAAALALTACGQENNSQGGGSSPAKGGKPTVCLVMKSLANQYFQDMQKGAEKHANDRGDLKLESVGTQNETDIDGQVSLVDKCITDKAAAIVLAPADSKALVQSVAKATQAGVKVVNIDVKLDDAALQQAKLDVPFVGPDNVEGAKQSGLALGKVLGPGGKVVILEGNPGAANAAQRKQGFQDAIAQDGLTLVDSKTAHWETDEAYTVFGNMLTAHPDIQGVMSSNDAMTLGVAKVIQQRNSKVKVASFDNIDAIKPYVQDGTVVSTLDQFPSQQASLGIDYAMKMLAGQNVTGWQKTPIKLITKSSAG